VSCVSGSLIFWDILSLLLISELVGIVNALILKTGHLFGSINMLDDLQVDRHTSKCLIPFISNCHELSSSCLVNV